jgi:hypothetical protein
VGAKVDTGQHLLVQSTGIRNAAGDVLSDVTPVDSARMKIAVTGDVAAIQQEVLVETARRETGEADLVPPTNVDGGVGKAQGLNMVQDGLFLGKEQTASSLTTTPSKHGGKERPTSLRRLRMLLGMTVAYQQGTNRRTPAFFAASARILSFIRRQLRTTSMPLSCAAMSSIGPSRSSGSNLTPLFWRASSLGLFKLAGRTSAVTFCLRANHSEVSCVRGEFQA